MAAIFKIWDDYISPATDEGMDIGSSSLKFRDLYLGGTLYGDIITITGDFTLSADASIIFRDAAIHINSADDGHLDIEADTSVDFTINTAEQIVLIDGKLYPSTDNDIDLGDATHEFKDAYIDGVLYADAIQDHGLTSGRVVYATTNGLLTDSNSFRFDGTTVTQPATNFTGELNLVFYDSEIVACNSDAVFVN